MAFDLDGLVKDLGVAGDEETQLRALFGKPERLTVLEKGQLRQADYSKAMNDLKKSQDDLKVANDRISAEMAEWARIQAEGGTITKAAQDRAEAAEAKALKLQQRVTRLATEAGLDPTKALEGLDTAPNPNPAPTPNPAPAVDPSKFASAEQFAQFGKYMFDFAAELPMIAAEHQQLTGERLDTRALRAEIEKRATQKGANLDPRAVWEEVHGIQAKRTEADATARKKELDAAEQRGFERARTEAALPVPPSHGTRSPVLRANGEGHQSKLQRHTPESSVREAAAMFASGKYRPQPTGAGT